MDEARRIEELEAEVGRLREAAQARVDEEEPVVALPIQGEREEWLNCTECGGYDGPQDWEEEGDVPNKKGHVLHDPSCSWLKARKALGLPV